MIKTNLILIAALVSMGALTARAAGQSAAPASSVKTWLSHLEDALTQTVLSADYQKGNAAQVAGVRGAKQDAADPNPVWKGGFADQAKAELKKERAALAQGVALLVKGSLDEGRAEILSFEKNYPNSPLRAAAQEALKKIDALSAAAKPPAQSAR